ncbi:TonB-dependent siderophore receptor [Methylomonas sp. YC3]
MKRQQPLILRDGFFTFGVPVSLANIDRVEVLKGPAAMLYGKLEPGGLVNVVTKRPQSVPYYSLQQQFGSFDTYRTLLDATGPATKDGSLSYRFDYEHLDSGSFRNFGFNKRDFIAPTVTWNISYATQVDFEFIYQKLESIRDHGIPFGLEQKGLLAGKLPRNLFIAEPTDHYNQEYIQGGMSLSHQINKDWQIKGKFNIAKNDISDAQTFGDSLIGNSELSRGTYASDDQTGTDFETINVIGHFDTWSLQHTLLIGGDHFNYNTNISTFCCDSAPSINLFNPQYGFNGFNLPSFINSPRYERERDYSWFGTYIQDQIKFGEEWSLLLGGRYDNTEFQEKETVASKSTKNENFSPRAGLMYHPLPWLGLYASYVQGTNAFNSGFTASGTALSPEQSRQYEAGVKGEWFDGKLSAGIAVFELTKENISVSDPDRALALQGYKQAIGEVRSQGIEFDIHGNLTDYLNLIGNYAFTDVKITKDTDSSGCTGNQGNRFANVPTHSGSLWTTYDFSGFGAHGFSSGIGVFLASDRAGNIANTFDLPGYARVDAMLKYKRQVGPSKVTLQFNIENLTDKDYMASSNGYGNNENQVIPGTPRTFLGSVKVEF